MSSHLDSFACQRAHAQLLARIMQRFDVITRVIEVGHLKIDFIQVREPDTVLDDIVAEADRREKVSGVKQTDDELHLPYWAELWESARAVSEWIAQNPVPSRLLDLGCGMGLCGTVAAALGYDVTMGDIENDALLFARVNSLAYGDAHVRRIDWRRDRLGQTFDLILGADVLYDKSHWPHLDEFWKAHLAEGGSVLLGEPGRQTGELFLDWIRPRGWRLEQSLHPIAGREKPIRLFRLFR